MPTITASTNDGSLGSALEANWDDAHDHVGSGVPAKDQASNAFNGVRYEKVSKGGVKYFLSRSFFDFDTSGISVAPSAATFKLKILTNNSCTPCIIAKSGHEPDAEEEDWFSTWITDQSVTLSGWGSGDITAYSSSTAIGSTGAFTDFTLNSDALSDMASLSIFKICILHNNDYNDIAPSSGSLRTGVYYANDSTSGNRPYLDYTAGTTVTHNATFFGTNF